MLFLATRDACTLHEHWLEKRRHARPSILRNIFWSLVQ